MQLLTHTKKQKKRDIVSRRVVKRANPKFQLRILAYLKAKTERAHWIKSKLTSPLPRISLKKYKFSN